MEITRHIADTDLSALFGIDLDGAAPASTDMAKVVCAKCHGRGNFVSYSGRVVGQCFACTGTGLSAEALAPTDLPPGTCIKCFGSGSWRPGRRCFACDGTGREPVLSALDVSAIATAFAAARGAGIKSPKLRLDTFVFSRAPDTGHNAGAIYVKQDGEYLGKVTDGLFRPTLACEPATKARVIAVASDPHNAAKAYGAKTGSCSCCGRELTNGESIALGIGPICRDKFGW